MTGEHVQDMEATSGSLTSTRRWKVTEAPTVLVSLSFLQKDHKPSSFRAKLTRTSSMQTQVT